MAHPLVLVKWLDAFASNGWQSKESAKDVAKSDECLCKSVGWLLRKDKEYVTLYSNKNEGQYGELMKGLGKTYAASL